MSIAETGTVARQGFEFFKENVEKSYMQKVKKAGKENVPFVPSDLLVCYVWSK